MALDVSSVATKFARSYELTAEDWRLVFQVDDRGEVGEHYEHFARGGGTLAFICGDLFESGVTPGPFDIIWSSRSLQGFSDEDLALAISALDARLQPDGECHVLVQNGHDAYQRIVSKFELLGYAINPETHRAGKTLRIVVASG